MAPLDLISSSVYLNKENVDIQSYVIILTSHLINLLWDLSIVLGPDLLLANSLYKS